MTFHAMTEHYEEITVCGKPALFTSIRTKRDTVPDGLYTYDVRHDDECRGIPCEIAPFVMVNYWGTIILAEPLELPDDGRRYINEDTDWNYAPFGGKEKNQKPYRKIPMKVCRMDNIGVQSTLYNKSIKMIHLNHSEWKRLRIH